MARQSANKIASMCYLYVFVLSVVLPSSLIDVNRDRVNLLQRSNSNQSHLKTVRRHYSPCWPSIYDSTSIGHNLRILA